MTTAYTSLLGLALPVTGELSGTWGDTVNTAITSLLDTAVAGTTSITTDADITLTTTTGASNQARQAIILWNPASGTTTRYITAPAQSKLYTVINASGGTQSIVIRGVGPTTGVTIAKGESAMVAWNGSDFVKVSSSGGALTLTDLTVTGNTILGDAAADTLTVNATSTFASPVNFQGLVKLPSTGRSAAAALTTTNPAFLYGVASTYTDTTSSGTIGAMAPFYSIAQPTLSTSNVTTYTNAATLYIANAPTTGGSATITNPYAAYIAAGATYLGGTLQVGGVTTLNNNLLFSADATYDIGASGATRPRDLFLSRNITIGGNTILGDATADTVTVNATVTSNLLFTDNTYDIGASGATRPRNLYLGNNITVGSLTSGRVTYAGASGLLSDSSTFLFDGTNLGVGVTSMAGTIDARTSTGATVIAGRTSNVGTSSQPGVFAMYAPNASGTARVWGQWRTVVNTATTGSETSSLIFSQQNAGGLVDNLYLDQSQNMGLLAAPSAWWSGRKGLQIGDGSAPGNANFLMSPGTACYAEMSTNYYQSGVSGGTLNRLATGAVLHYGQNNGQHIWQIAPSAGTGVAPVFNQVLTLTTTGLGINQPSPSAVLHAVSPISTSAGYFVIGSNNTSYGGGTSVSSIVKVGNSGGAQTGIAYYAGAPYDGSHATGGYYPLSQFGLYVDDLYSYYGNNSRAGKYNWGLYVKGGGFNYMQGTLGVSTEPSYWLTSQSAVQVYRATVACNTGGYVSFGNNWYQDYDTSADTAIVTGYVQRISLNNNQVLFQSANEQSTSSGGTSVTMTSRALFDNYGQLYNAASHTGYDASEYNIVDGNAIPYTLRKIGNYGNYQGGSSGLQIRGNLGVTGDPSYGYILLCNYTTGAQVDKFFFQGDIYFNRGSYGAGNNYSAVSIGCSTAYTSSNAGGVRIGGGGAAVQIVYGTYGGVVYYFARFSGTNSSVYVTIDAIYVSGVTPQIIADGSVSAVTVVATL